MTFDDYQRAAMRTLKSARDAQTMLTNGALGLAGEAGEVADLVKKNMYPSKPGDGVGIDARLYDEIGDVLWYVALLCEALGVTLHDVAQSNIDKLTDRHRV